MASREPGTIWIIEWRSSWTDNGCGATHYIRLTASGRVQLADGAMSPPPGAAGTDAA